MSKSDYMEGQVLTHFFISAVTRPANVYFGLFTALPSDAGGGTEVTGNAYARITRANDNTTWTLSGSQVSNAVQLTFNTPAPGAWGTIVGMGAFTALSGGNLLIWAPLVTPRATVAGNAVSFAIGALTHSED